MKYIYGTANAEYEIVKEMKRITIGLAFIQAHRNLFVGDFVDLINDHSKVSFRINSIKYSNKPDRDVVMLGKNKSSEYFTIFELKNIYGK